MRVAVKKGPVLVSASFAGVAELGVSDAAFGVIGTLSVSLVPNSGVLPTFDGTGLTTATLAFPAYFSAGGLANGSYNQRVLVQEASAATGSAAATVAVKGSVKVVTGFAGAGTISATTVPKPTAAPVGNGVGALSAVTGVPALPKGSGALSAAVVIPVLYGSSGTTSAEISFPAAFGCEGTLSAEALLTTVVVSAAFNGAGALNATRAGMAATGVGTLAASILDGARVRTVTFGATADLAAEALTPAVFTDDFNRANGALGANWVTIDYAPLIAGNRVQDNGAFVNAARWTAPLHTDSHEVSCAIVSRGIGYGGAYTGVFLRGAANKNRVEAVVTSNTVAIRTWIGGVPKVRSNKFGVSLMGGVALRCTAVGNVYNVYLAGAPTPIITWTDTDAMIPVAATNRFAGLICEIADDGTGTGNQVYGFAIDDWQARDI
ncbi:hypothetical protein [Nocardia tenerifensis]|uniref:hypothetical protein n=1 Tax=Nocardia tenerifensis TaxID=228006 RepID=UPI0002FACAA1|nr:hypothetical protein [Nocardia tenerifensis]